KARAEGLGIPCNVGIAERTERLLITLVAAGLTGLGVPYVLAIWFWALAVLSLVTFGQRVDAVRRAAAGRPAAPVPAGEPRRAHELLRPLLVRGVPPAGDQRREADRGHALRGEGPAARHARLRARGGAPAAAYGQLGPGRSVDHRLWRAQVHHRGRAAQARVAGQAVLCLQGRARVRGAPRDRRCAAVRDPRPAVARGRAGLPARRPGRHR